MLGVATPGFIFYLLTCLFGVLPTTLYRFGCLVAFIYKGGRKPGFVTASRANLALQLGAWLLPRKSQLGEAFLVRE